MYIYINILKPKITSHLTWHFQRSFIGRIILGDSGPSWNQFIWILPQSKQQTTIFFFFLSDTAFRVVILSGRNNFVGKKKPPSQLIECSGFPSNDQVWSVLKDSFTQMMEIWKGIKRKALHLLGGRSFSLRYGVCCRLLGTIGLFMALVVAISRQGKAFIDNSQSAVKWSKLEGKEMKTCTCLKDRECS